MTFQCSNIWLLLHWVPLKFLWSTFTMLTWWNLDQKKKRQKSQVGSSAGCHAIHVSFILSDYIYQYMNRVHSGTCKRAHFPSALCHSLPTTSEDHRDLILLITSPVVNSGGRTQSIQLTAWQAAILTSQCDIS